MVKRLITAIAAAVFLGVVTSATARVREPAFDAALTARLERSWTWQSTPHACGPVGGQGRRVVIVRTAGPVPIGAAGGTLAVVGTLELEGRQDAWESLPEGACVAAGTRCAVRRTPIAGSVRLTLRGGVVRLGSLRYRTTGRAGCAPEIAAVRAALRGEPRLESAPVRDRSQKLRNERIPRISVEGSFNPSAHLGGGVSGDVRAEVRWSLVLNRR